MRGCVARAAAPGEDRQLEVAPFSVFAGSGRQAGAGLVLVGFIRHLARREAVWPARGKWGRRPRSDGSRVARRGRRTEGRALTMATAGDLRPVAVGVGGVADRTPAATWKRGVARGGGWCGEGRAKCLMNPARTKPLLAGQ
ncbi:hypothetical protein ES708_18375 [subsurface metagenome]